MESSNVFGVITPRPQQQQEGCKGPIFDGNNEYFIKNGETLLKERISLFDGRTNPIHCFSVGDLKSMNASDYDTFHLGGLCHDIYSGVWNGNSVLVKVFRDDELSKLACREIAVATQMGTHKNVHRLLGCCLDTNYPVLVYQCAENGTLQERILMYKEESKESLDWKDRLRIGWEIAHAVAYLHTAFRRPIVHRNLKPATVYLDENCSARLSDFSLCISIPEGEKHVDDMVVGTWAYVAPEYVGSGRLTERIDVFSFGAILLILLTGKMAFSKFETYPGWDILVERVNANCLADIVDPEIMTNGPVADEHQLKAFAELALRCLSVEEERRPTMVDVATQLKNMIMSSSDSL